jgi:hypothetical protein
MRKYSIILFILLVINNFCPAQEIINLNPVSPSFDALVLLLPGGKFPASPWESLRNSDRELMWSLGAQGLLVQRTAWSAYMFLVPPGTGERFLPMLERLSAEEQISTCGVWVETLDLIPAGRDSSVILIFHACAEKDPVHMLPVCSSRLLCQGSDTLIISGSWKNDIFLIAGSEHDEEISSGFWRGFGIEIIPAGENSVKTLVTSTMTGTPSDLSGFHPEFTHSDSLFRNGWGGVFASVDSLVKEIYPPADEIPQVVIWLRGTGSDENLFPWKVSTPGPPPGRATVEIELPEILNNPFLPFGYFSPDTFSSVSLAFSTANISFDNSAVMAVYLERLLSRELLPLLYGTTGVIVRPETDSLRIFLLSEDYSGFLVDHDFLREVLMPSVLSPPDGKMIHNSTVRASVMLGREILQPTRYSFAMQLPRLLGLL